ncbi:GNAT family N-acetyltransferase [Actibacterium pelagium]|uniref:GCN5 family N-acetyltransferase n=1 Tax=Actibacterium pelagium TaxID=2029103 RepID=A0A917AEM0_9RHOB|nr:GNAT family N-acetyltransferase [Actibacterium pelagium]GGE44839.1 GCN5 family N-acetyltransferase [Actibacterium pelagium]
MALPNLQVRPIAPSDKEAWHALWRAYLEFYESEVSPEVYETTFARLVSDDPNEYRGLIAEVDGKPVGLAHYLSHRHCWRVENVVYLQDLFADPKVRGQGVGRALIQGVYDDADALGAGDVYWMTQDFNTEARKLYDRIGRLTPFIKYVKG